MPGRPIDQTMRSIHAGGPSGGNAGRQQSREEDLLTSGKLSLSNKGLTEIPRIAQAVLEADLSANFIVRLVLTSNQLTRVEDLTNLPALRHLLLQDNCLCTYQDLCLDMLAALPQLQTLYLQNSDGSQPNPVCTRPDYKKEVLSSLKDLRNLDGERNPNSTEKELDPLPTITKHSNTLQSVAKLSDASISKFLPEKWDSWLPAASMALDQASTGGRSKIEADTAKLLDECVVLSNVLQEQIDRTAFQLS